MTAKRKKKFPGPWRTSDKRLREEFILSIRQGRLDIRTTYDSETYRITDKWGNRETHRMQQPGPSLDYMLKTLDLSEKEHSILVMLEGATALIETLIKRFDSKMWIEERKAKEVRARAHEARKAKLAAEKDISLKLEKVRKRQYSRQLEV